MNDGVDLSPPERLLLATDLSARCHHRLKPAKQFAGEWLLPRYAHEHGIEFAVPRLRGQAGQARALMGSKGDHLRNLTCDTLLVSTGRRNGVA